MFKYKAIYGTLVLLSILLGLLSRYLTHIPLWVGSALWALMVYFIVRFLLVRTPIAKAAVISILFSYGIELSQLYQAAWLNAIRHTLVGHLVLGQGFEWGDLVAYTLGIGLAVLFDWQVIRLLFNRHKQLK